MKHNRRRARTLVVAAFAAAAALALAAAASAAAAPTTKTIIQEGSQTVPLTSTPPCLGTATITYQQVYRLVDLGDAVHITDNQTGTFVFVSDADGKIYTGRYTGTFDIQGNPNFQFVFGGTFHLIGTAEDGSRLRFIITAKLTFPAISPAAPDEPLVDFTRVDCALE